MVIVFVICHQVDIRTETQITVNITINNSPGNTPVWKACNDVKSYHKRQMWRWCLSAHEYL